MLLQVGPFSQDCPLVLQQDPRVIHLQQRVNHFMRHQHAQLGFLLCVRSLIEGCDLQLIRRRPFCVSKTLSANFCKHSCLAPPANLGCAAFQTKEALPNTLADLCPDKSLFKKNVNHVCSKPFLRRNVIHFLARQCPFVAHLLQQGGSSALPYQTSAHLKVMAL